MFAQEDSTKFEIMKYPKRNNTFYASVGTALFYGEIGLFYERRLYHRKKVENFDLSMNLGAGGFFVIFEESGVLITPNIVFLFGKHNNKFEMTYGGNIFIWDNYYYPYEFVPSGSFGYRYQNSWSGFIFRIGVGYPEGLYGSLGYSFGK